MFERENRGNKRDDFSARGVWTVVVSPVVDEETTAEKVFVVVIYIRRRRSTEDDDRDDHEHAIVRFSQRDAFTAVDEPYIL